MDNLTIPPNPLFDSTVNAEQISLLKCLNAQVMHYDKGHCLFREQEKVDWLGIVLSGSIEASKLEMSGKRLIISILGRGSVFGNVFSLHSEHQSPVTVTALECVSALMIPTAKLLNQCQKRCASHNKLIQNLLNSVSEKYFELQNRLFCITRSTVREKIMYFLESASGTAASGCNSHVFRIPFDRASLAEYLNVERSALSRELSAMKRDGLIDYHKNSFRLISHG